MTQFSDDASVAILAYPGVQMSAVLGLADLFMIASGNSNRADGPELTVTQLTLPASAKSNDYDAVILPPNLTGARGEDATDILRWLRNQHATGTIMCSVCAGAFWLGHAGLLSGRPATTHWALEGEFRAAFPDVELAAEHLLVDDNDIVTAGGLMAWVDLGLFVVNRFLGPQTVSQTARHLLVDPGGREQRNYRSFRPPLGHGDAPVLKVQHWLEAHCETEISVKDMAARSHLSPRTFLRRFKAATGYTPIAYLQNLRIEKARGLLERTRIPVNEIGWRSGYADPSAFGRLFLKATGLTPGEYRGRFGVQS
ncbi:GlxA family transcriptional regulator [Hoeflea poritis]|uniref:Helix-turn-helix domain-containing protein n=1 Tax=Hoeflea poritis TaxID=2993659 RepID=A0ABT4VRL0_9HYPH|nr:helix-turn-helix domain-containing protein [Hoeflea poritis]MDA4847352.1 helix-turn-helix domain-containing protein [Hoeflea poritis]